MNPTDASGEQEIPAGQHSNTPFRRNRSVNGLGLSKPLSPSSSPTFPIMRKSMSSPLSSRPVSSSSQRVSEGLTVKSLDQLEGVHGHLYDPDVAMAVYNRKSEFMRKGFGQSEDSYEEAMNVKRAARKSSRAKSTSSTCSGHADTGLSIEVDNRPPTPSKRRGSPPRRARELSGLSEKSPTPDEGGGGHFSAAEDGEEEDDDEYSVDEDDIDLELDQLGMRSRVRWDICNTDSCGSAYITITIIIMIFLFCFYFHFLLGSHTQLI